MHTEKESICMLFCSQKNVERKGTILGEVISPFSWQAETTSSHLEWVAFVKCMFLIQTSLLPEARLNEADIKGQFYFSTPREPMQWLMVTLKTGTCQSFSLSGKKKKKYILHKEEKQMLGTLQWIPVSLRVKVHISIVVLRGPNDLLPQSFLPCVGLLLLVPLGAVSYQPLWEPTLASGHFNLPFPLPATVFSQKSIGLTWSWFPLRLSRFLLTFHPIELS